jgi:cell filamentation protein
MVAPSLVFHVSGRADPYCYPGTTVLQNLKNLKSRAKLEAYERVMTAQRGEEPLPSGHFSVSHYYAIHRHIFQDIYSWAGKPRTVRISKVRSGKFFVIGSKLGNAG